MGSINFILLEDRLPQLAETANQVERYVYSDPSAAIAKARIFVEHLLYALIKFYGLNISCERPLADLITLKAIRGLIQYPIMVKINVIRDYGNRCAHGKKATPEDALLILEDVYELCRWAASRICKVKGADYPVFRKPENSAAYQNKIFEEEIELLQRKLKQMYRINASYIFILARIICLEKKINTYPTFTPCEQEISAALNKTRPHVDYIFSKNKLKNIYKLLYKNLEDCKRDNSHLSARKKFVHLRRQKFISENRISTIKEIKKRYYQSKWQRSAA